MIFHYDTHYFVQNIFYVKDVYRSSNDHKNMICVYIVFVLFNATTSHAWDRRRLERKKIPTLVNFIPPWAI